MTKRQYTIDAHAVREMTLTMENDGRLHEQRMIPILNNLQRKINKGVYDAQKAVILIEYAVTDYERKHGVEIVGKRLNVAERHAVAVELLDTIESQLTFKGANQ